MPDCSAIVLTGRFADDLHPAGTWPFVLPVGTSGATDEATRLGDGCMGRVDGDCLRRASLRHVVRALTGKCCNLSGTEQTGLGKRVLNFKYGRTVSWIGGSGTGHRLKNG